MKRIISFVGLVLLIAISVVGCGEKPKAQEEKLVPVEIIKASTRDLTHTLNTSGEILAGADVAVVPKVSGRVAAVRVKMGDKVNQGQVLFELENTETRNALSQSEATLALNQANLTKAQRALEDAKINFERNKVLFDAQAISKSQFEQAESTLVNAEASLKVAEAQLKQSEVALDTTRENYNNATITSPITGVVASVNIDAGEMVNPQTSPITVVQMDIAKVKVNLSENVIDSIKPGAEVPVTIQALNKDITGTILSVAPKADPLTRAFPVEIQLSNTDGQIKPGMVAKLNLSTGTSQGIVALPTDALLERDGQYSVFIVEEGKAKELSVKIGVTSGDLTEVTEGVKVGQAVIVKGNRLVKDGQKVQVVKELGGASK